MQQKGLRYVERVTVKSAVQAWEKQMWWMSSWGFDFTWWSCHGIKTTIRSHLRSFSCEMTCTKMRVLLVLWGILFKARHCTLPCKELQKMWCNWLCSVMYFNFSFCLLWRSRSLQYCQAAEKSSELEMHEESTTWHFVVEINLSLHNLNCFNSGNIFLFLV